MHGIFSPIEGVTILVSYAAMAIALTLLVSRFSRSKDDLLVAHREITVWPSAFSIAATWVWAPALFVAAQQAYTNGIAGVFWFTVPNVLCLVLFAFFAIRLRRMVPAGFTISDFMRERYSGRVQNAYLFQLVGLATCSFAVQLLAGAAAISMLTGLSFFWVSVALAVTALSYSLWSGIRASVATDYAQMVIILIVAGTVVPWALYQAGGLSVIWSGIGGISGTKTNVFDSTLLMTFGVPVTVGLLSGPFGDQSFWQRAFSTKESDVRRAFLWSAVIFAMVPLTLCIPGFIAAGIGLKPASVQMVNLETILHLLPKWVVVPFTLMLLSGLVSTLDSNLCAVSSLAGHDAIERWGLTADVVSTSRWAMVILAVGGVAIANIPGLTILYLFLFYGTLRSSTLLPTVLTILGVRMTERGVFYGIVTAITIGLPIFAYGHIGGGGPAYIIGGSLTTVLLSGLLAVAMSVRERRSVSA